MAEEAEKLSQLEERMIHQWNEVEKMEKRVAALPDAIQQFESKVTDLTKLIEEVKETFEEVNEHYEDYFEKSDGLSKSKLETVTEHHAAITQFQKVSEQATKDLSEFKEFVNGNEALKKDGFKKELETLHTKNKESNEELQNKWEGTYNTLYQKIEGLLPGATSTGLSKAYQDQKNNYKWPVIIWSSVFGLTVGGMMWFGYNFYTETKTFEDSLRHILSRLPFFIPAIWLAIFASKQQSQYKRLQQEYIYKETLAKSYEAYKREIDKLPDGDEKDVLHEKLITSMVEMCGYNPSLTLEHKSHEEKGPISGSSIWNVLNKKDKRET